MILSFFEISSAFLNNTARGFLIFFLLWLKKILVICSKFLEFLKLKYSVLGSTNKIVLLTFGIGKNDLEVLLARSKEFDLFDNSQ